MALPAQTWQNAYKKMQPTVQGGAMPAADPGEMGNIAYAPNMMKFGQQGAPQAKELYQGVNNPGAMATGGPPVQGQQGSTPALPALPPEYAQRTMQLIMDAIRKRSRRY